MKSINPEVVFKSTPVEFSGYSKISEVKSEDYRRGIILDSPEEFAEALIVYNGGSVDKSRATQNNLMDAMGDKGNGLGGLLILMSGAKNAEGFIGRLTKEAIEELNSKGSFKRSFDYDAMGTNFFKTSVEGKKVGTKYVLELNAAYVGTEPENRLAETLKKPMALVRSTAMGMLSVVDDWWFNADLNSLLEGLPISKKHVSKLIEYWTSDGYSDKPKATFKHNDQKFDLDISVSADRYLRPKDGQYGTKYFQIKPTGKVVGGAWSTWDKSGNQRVDPWIRENPSIDLNITLPSKQYFKPPVVEPEQMVQLQEARDYLASILRDKI